MSLLKLPFLLGIFSVTGLATSLAAHAQSAPPRLTPIPSDTVLDAAGNLVRKSAVKPAQNGSDLDVAVSERHRPKKDGRHRNGEIIIGTTYYVPTAPPYYGYPYPAPTYNNYYFPAQPSTTVIGAPAFPWQKPTTITNIPLGGQYGGYPAPAYPPVYPPYYGYPAPVYGYPVYPGAPYPGYGTTTTVYGNVPGSVYSQSYNSGYGISIGNGGISVQLGNRRSTTTTTVTQY